MAEKLDVDVTDLTSDLYSRADEVESEEAGREWEDEGEQWGAASPTSPDDVATMFQSLQEKLED